MLPVTARASRETVQVSRIGISLPNRLAVLGMPADDLLQLATQAEESGLIGSVWAGDSLLTKPRLEALTLLGAVAARTTQIRIGTMCLASFAFREPILLAIQAASVDQLSGGRLTLGIGVGPGPSGGPAARAELSRFGVSSRARLDLLETNVARLRQVWASGDAGGDPGDAPVEPRPRQERLPILIAGSPAAEKPDVESRVLDRVARLGDGWISDALSASRFLALRAILMDAADQHGRASRIRETVMHVPVTVAASRTPARRTAQAFLDRHTGAPAGEVSLPEAGAYGPPELVFDHLAGLLAAGVDTLVLRLMSPDPRGQLDLLLEGVLSRLVPAPPADDGR